MASEAKKRAVAKYNAKNYDKLSIRLRKDEAQALKEYLGERSLNGFVVEAIREKMEREQ